MALGRQGERQSELMVSWAELPRSPGHAFYDRLQTVLVANTKGWCRPMKTQALS
ncbi:MAG: hypothetical protein K0R61_5609 [Microvirga sp.]|jgi:hypothetical protein|nr:hypothetical protein [Microvirga sp.]